MGRLLSAWNGAIKGQADANIGNFLLQILHGFLHLLEVPWKFIVQKFDEILPPETRAETLRHWFTIGGVVVLAILLLLFFIYCVLPLFIRCCVSLLMLLGSLCHGLWNCISFIFVFCGRSLGQCFCFCCTSGSVVKMMKAPGRGYLMPRQVFESDPRGYFINLRK